MLSRTGGGISGRNTRHCPDDEANASKIADKTAQIHNTEDKISGLGPHGTCVKKVYLNP